MGNSSMRALPSGGALKMSRYVLDSQGKDNRVQFVSSVNLVSDPLDPEANAAELRLYKGRKFDCIASRISFASCDHLDEKQAQAYAEKFVSEYLHDRPSLAVWHGDTDNQHVHIISSFLDPNGRALNFGGYGASREGVRRMEIVDRLSAEFGMKLTPRQPGRYTSAKNREGIAAKRMRAAGQSRWTDHLKSCITASAAIASDRTDFVGLMALQDIDVRYRGSGVSYGFVDLDGKKRLIRGRRLGTDYQPFCEPKAPRQPKQATSPKQQPANPTPTTTTGKPTATTGGSTGGGGTRLSESERARLGDNADGVQQSLDDAQQAVQAGAAETAQLNQQKGR